MQGRRRRRRKGGDGRWEGADIGSKGAGREGIGVGRGAMRGEGDWHGG